jgi:hypothetical protein
MIAKLQEAAQATRLGPELIALALLILFSVAVAAFGSRRVRETDALARADADGDAKSPILSIALAFALLTGITAWFLIYRLDDFSGADAVLTWETPTIARQFEITREGTSTAQMFVDGLKWDDGVVARGENMLLYGPPTHALLKAWNFTPKVLRVVSVFWAVASLPLMFLLGRRCGGGSVLAGLAATAFLSLDQTFIFLGHYGTGLSASLFATLLAVNVVWWLLEHPRPPWWAGPAGAGALFLATLHYSPARIVVLLLLGLIAWCVVFESSRLGARHRLAFALIILCGILVVAGEHRAGATRFFLAARGEQAAYFVEDPYYIRSVLKRPDSRQPLTLGEKLTLTGKVAAANLPSLAWHFSPSWRLSPDAGLATIGSDPPRVPVLRAALFPLVVLGLMLGWSAILAPRPRISAPAPTAWDQRWPIWRQGFLFAWVVGTGVALLFTTRVDSYRLHLLVIPLGLWAGLGTAAYDRWLHHSGVPRWLGASLATMMLGLLAWQNVWWEFMPEVRAAAKGKLMAEFTAHLPKNVPVNLISNLGVGEMGWLQLEIEESNRRQLGPPLAKLSGPPQQLLSQDMLLGPPEKLDDERLDQIEAFEESMRNKQTLIGPGEILLPLVEYLKQRGYKMDSLALPSNVSEPMRPDWSVQLIPVQPTPPFASMAPAAEVTAPRVGTAANATSPARTVSLVGNPPLRSTFGFSPSQFNKTSQGQPIRMRGINYVVGIGMHTPASVTYAVPGDAEFFEATIGFDDEVLDSTKADATFRVRDKSGRLLFSSGRLLPSDGPKLIRVPIRGAGELTLSVSEARNGRDDDHVNWGEPVFVLAP